MPAPSTESQYWYSKPVEPERNRYVEEELLAFKLKNKCMLPIFSVTSITLSIEY
jgi:hypothetical protein